MNFEYFTLKHEAWLKLVQEHYNHVLESGVIESFELAALRELAGKIDAVCPSCFQTRTELKIARGQYNFPDLELVVEFLKGDVDIDKVVVAEEEEDAVLAMAVNVEQKKHIPKKDTRFQNTSTSRKLKKIIKTGRFFPVYLSGNTGCGKTTVLTQVCAQLGRGLIRVNITNETDELDLIGGYSLIDGNTVYEHGPVVEAMLTGSVLLIDEIDLGSPKLMCLQPVLEGNGIFIKKTGEWVFPAPGFTVVATANTKGQGSETGHFIGAQYLNAAMMDRFPYWMDVDYPSKVEERKILHAYWKSVSEKDVPEKFVDLLLRWASEIRGAFIKDSCPDTISTRRLLDTLGHKHIFNLNDDTTVSEMITRFDGETQSAFESFWKMIQEPDVPEVTESEGPPFADPSDGAGSGSAPSTKTWTNPNNSNT